MKYRLTFSEKIKKFSALTVISLPLPIIKLLVGKPIQRDGLTMDPVMQFMIKYFVEHEVGYIPSYFDFRKNNNSTGIY